MTDKKKAPAADDGVVEAMPPEAAVTLVRAGDRLRVTLADGAALVHVVAADGPLDLAAVYPGAKVALPDGRVVAV